jgi:hypothetical protein
VADEVLAPLRFAAAPNGEQTQARSGRFEPGAPDWVYLPVQVPDGVREISVAYRYDRPTPPPGMPENALDLGVFDDRGIGPGAAAGFRGWSGGSRDRFTISGSRATPGYLPGPVRSGTWHVLLGPYTVAPQGMDWTVEVTLRFGAPEPELAPEYAPEYAPARAAGPGPAWYRGDMHLHTVHSDGQLLPTQAAAGARAAGLDYIVSTDHNTSSASRVWGAYAGPELLIIDGEEITTRNGHYLALGLPAGTWIDWRYRSADGVFPDFVEQIHASGALAVASHPFAPCLGCAWKFGYRGLDAVEVWNGPWTLDDEASVAAWDGALVAAGSGGAWLPAVGNSDFHGEPQVIGLPHNVVYADGLDRRSILDGVRAGRLWIAESAAVELSFTAAVQAGAAIAGVAIAGAAIAGAESGRSAGVGERLAVPHDVPITVTLAVAGTPGGVVRLVTDEGERLLAPLPPGGAGTVSWTTTPRNARYVRAEVRRPQHTETTRDTMVALTNPIFLGALAGPG